MTLAYRMRMYRLHAGLNGVTAAAFAGISATHLSELERGKHRPTKGTLCALSRAYKVPVEQIAGDDPAWGEK